MLLKKSTLKKRISNLNNYFYSEHQQYLYDTIKELHGKGLGYRKIAHHLNKIEIKTISQNYRMILYIRVLYYNLI